MQLIWIDVKFNFFAVFWSKESNFTPTTPAWSEKRSCDWRETSTSTLTTAAMSRTPKSFCSTTTMFETSLRWELRKFGSKKSALKILWSKNFRKLEILFLFLCDICRNFSANSNIQKIVNDRKLTLAICQSLNSLWFNLWCVLPAKNSGYSVVYQNTQYGTKFHKFHWIKKAPRWRLCLIYYFHKVHCCFTLHASVYQTLLLTWSSSFKNRRQNITSCADAKCMFRPSSQLDLALRFQK